MLKKRRKCLTVLDAKPAVGQHQKPCSDCPWARESLPGWLGEMSAQEWIQTAHGDGKIDCHTLLGAQCAGAAIYRRNVGKSPRDSTCLRLEADRTTVFATPNQFLEHHGPRDPHREQEDDEDG